MIFISRKKAEYLLQAVYNVYLKYYPENSNNFSLPESALKYLDLLNTRLFTSLNNIHSDLILLDDTIYQIFLETEQNEASILLHLKHELNTILIKTQEDKLITLSVQISNAASLKDLLFSFQEDDTSTIIFGNPSQEASNEAFKFKLLII